MTFHLLVEEIKNLSFEEKEEMKNLLDKLLIEENRDEFYKSYEDAKKEIKQGKVKFSSNIEELKKSLKD